MAHLRSILWTALFLLPAANVRADQPEASTRQAGAAALTRFTPSLVRVAFTLQFDRGQNPTAIGWMERCPRCGQAHGSMLGSDLVMQERPFEIPGFLISPTRVISKDPVIHPRFIKSIHVIFGEQRVEAKPVAFAEAQSAIQFELAAPLKGASPINFVNSPSDPRFVVNLSRLFERWTAQIRPFERTDSLAEDGRRFCMASETGLLLDREYNPIALWLSNEFPTDDSWPKNPESWSWMSQQKLDAWIDSLAPIVAAGLPRIDLRFRSPRTKGGGMSDRYIGIDLDEEDDLSDQSGQQKNVLGIVISENRVLVLANLRPARTARLDQIAVRMGKSSLPAKFLGSLRDFGAFVVELKQPISSPPIKFSAEKLDRLRERLLAGVEIRIQGQNLVADFGRYRISDFDTFRAGRLYPRSTIDDRDAQLAVFDQSNALVAISVAVRKRVTDTEHESLGGDTMLTPAAYLASAMADLPAAFDPNNVPRSEADENRIAWLGAELQPLTRDLARANGVADATNDGSFGAIVSHVYSNSPAAAAGVQPGWILLRLRIAGEPKPLEVRLDRYGGERFGGEGYPWDKLDEVPAEYLDRLPPPWPSVENNLTRALTELGSGARYQADFANGGKTITKDFEIQIAPPHFASAPLHKSKDLGLTVRDLTYEVRRYFQKADTDPGVIVSRVEPGGKAAVAKIIPFEIITQVNNEPVADAQAFKRLCEGQKELRLSVSRMTQNRIVKIRSAGAEKSKPSQPDDSAKTPEPDADAANPARSK